MNIQAFWKDIIYLGTQYRGVCGYAPCMILEAKAGEAISKTNVLQITKVAGHRYEQQLLVPSSLASFSPLVIPNR